MPAPRAYWRGFLKLSFVSCPIALYPATSAAERIAFRQVNRRTGHRLKHRLVDAVTGEAVEPADKARGYEVGENEFLLVSDRALYQARSEGPARDALPPDPAQPETPPPAGATSLAAKSRPRGSAAERHQYEEGEERADEADADESAAPEPPVARPQNTHTIEIERFLPAGQIDARYLEKPYYVAPREPIGQEAFAVIRDAMSAASVVGLGRVVLSSRERPLLLAPMGRGFLGVTLRFAHEVRSEADYFAAVPPMRLPAEMMALAQHIIETKSSDFDPSMLEDHYRNALVRILREKQAKRPALAPAVKPSPENVVSLMDALRRSLGAPRPPAKSVARRKAKPTKRASRQR